MIVRHRNGITLIEMVLSMFLLLVPTVMLWAMLARSYQFRSGVQQRSIAAELAQTKFEQTLKIPFDQWNDRVASGLVPTATGVFPAPNAAYSYLVTPTVLDWELRELSVQVTAPSQKTVTAYTYTTDVKLYGVAASAYTLSHYVAFSRYDGDFFRVDFNTGPLPGAVTRFNYPSLPGGSHVGGLCCDQAYTLLFAADRVNYGMRQLLNPASATPTWGSAITTSGVGEPGGLAYGTANGGMVWYVDRGNHALWNHDIPNNDMKGPYYASYPAPPLGEPMGIACSQNGQTGWVGDIADNCLRRFTLVPWTVTFDTTLYRPPISLGHMGLPRGIACSTDGNTVYVDDSLKLWSYNYSLGTWSAVSLPAAMQTLASPPYGLCLDSLDPCGGTWNLWAWGGVGTTSAYGGLFRYTFPGCGALPTTAPSQYF